MNNIIKCKHCGELLQPTELVKRAKTFEQLGNRGREYISWHCPYCQAFVIDTIKYKFYYGEDGEHYLELHDSHTLWDINCESFDCDEYEFIVSQAIKTMEEKHKNLKVYLLGRSGRHVCVEDSPVNRRRYQSLVNTAIKQEQWVIDWFNNKNKEVK